MPQEPSQIELITTRLVGNILPGFYREYVYQLPIKEQDHILDYGSGSGNCSKYLAKRLSDHGHLTCVDISRRWHNEIQKRLKKSGNVSFILGKIENMNLSESSFDGIFIHYVLHDIPESQRKSRIAFLAALVKPGGKIYIREPENPNHGISELEIHNLLFHAGLSKISVTRAAHPLAGKFTQAIYQK